MMFDMTRRARTSSILSASCILLHSAAVCELVAVRFSHQFVQAGYLCCLPIPSLLNRF